MYEFMKNRWWEYICSSNSLGFHNTSKTKKVFETVYHMYTEPHRHYHDISHIKNCLMVMEPFRYELNRNVYCGAAVVESAIWFHDIIYNTQSNTNEEDSARLARYLMFEVGIRGTDVDTLIRAQVVRMILLTKHLGASSETPLTWEEELFLDIDLSILGASPHAFQKYDEDIQKEYSWVPADVYCQKRAEVLQNFLNREHIYLNPAMRDSYEHQARVNLENAIKNLKVTK